MKHPPGWIKTLPTLPFRVRVGGHCRHGACVVFGGMVMVMVMVMDGSKEVWGERRSVGKEGGREVERDENVFCCLNVVCCLVILFFFFHPQKGTFVQENKFFQPSFHFSPSFPLFPLFSLFPSLSFFPLFFPFPATIQKPYSPPFLQCSPSHTRTGMPGRDWAPTHTQSPTMPTRALIITSPATGTSKAPGPASPIPTQTKPRP